MIINDKLTEFIYKYIVSTYCSKSIYYNNEHVMLWIIRARW